MIDTLALSKNIKDKTRTERLHSKTAVVRQVLGDIEAARASGHTYVAIAEWLKPCLDITGKHLAVIVNQLHKRKKKRVQLPLFDAPAQFRMDPKDNGRNLI